MGWVRLDDAFYDHQKQSGAGPLAELLWVRALAWSNRNLTDGFIPRVQVRRLADYAEDCDWMGRPQMPDMLAGKLVEVGLWDEIEGGYQVHDYHDFQPTSGQVRGQQANQHEAKVAGGKARAAGAKRDQQGRLIPAGQGQQSQQDDQQEASSPPPAPLALVQPQPQPQPQEANQKHTSTAPANAFAERFEEFWQAYPRKVGKPAALKAWKRIRNATPETVIAGVQPWSSSWTAMKTDIKFVPHPATWLNDRRWEDTPAAATSIVRTANGLVQDMYGNWVR
jgi:hypothetical protein